MAGTVTVILGKKMPRTWQPKIFFADSEISYATVSVDNPIAPGVYSIPSGQQSNLDWWYDNGFFFNAFGRLHVGRLMADNTPDTVEVL